VGLDEVGGPIGVCRRNLDLDLDSRHPDESGLPQSFEEAADSFGMESVVDDLCVDWVG
jgi:hypothetical protein